MRKTTQFSSAAIILAAGKGTRMRSELPKALHEICGEPMLGHLLETVESLGVRKTIVVGGHHIDLLKEFLHRRGGVIPPVLVHQKKQLGSGHAVNEARNILSRFNGSVLVLYCDTPLLSADTIKRLLENHFSKQTDCTLLSVELDKPFGYGRIQRSLDGRVDKIIEEDDASSDEKTIREINVGAYVFDAKKLFEALKRVPRNLKKNETYLTDVVGILAAEGRVECVKTQDRDEVLGVNSRADLARLEGIMQKSIIEGHMERGVSIKSPQNTTIDADVRIGQDTVLLPGTVIEEGSVIGRNCILGPYARIRGKSEVGDGSVIGNFVEIVRSKIGKRTRVKHLSYVGDAVIGSDVNVGAGTITANYDGKKKHKTIIGDGAQIGSGTVLVAPVTIGKKAKTGAGAVVTKNTKVPANSVMVGVPARKLK